MDELEKLLSSIAHFDSDPAVYNVDLIWQDYMSGYRVCVQFRRPRGSVNDTASVTTQGNTAIEALQAMLATLQKHYSRCSVCGQYGHGAAQAEKGE